MSRFSTLIELVNYLKLKKKYWLIPIIVLMVLLGLLVVLGEGSVLSPFIYSLF